MIGSHNDSDRLLYNDSTSTICSVAETLFTKDSFFDQNTSRSAITLPEDAISGEGLMAKKR